MKIYFIFLSNLDYGVRQKKRNAPVLMAGQSYSVVVALNMPESPQNLGLGMFMSCLQMRSTDQYQSKIADNIRVAKIMPFYFNLSALNANCW